MPASVAAEVAARPLAVLLRRAAAEGEKGRRELLPEAGQWRRRARRPCWKDCVSAARLRGAEELCYYQGRLGG